VGSRFLSPSPLLRLQLLHRGHGKEFQSSVEKGMLDLSIFFGCFLVNPQYSMQSASRYPLGPTSKERPNWR
jgi:hypothetical protein